MNINLFKNLNLSSDKTIICNKKKKNILMLFGDIIRFFYNNNFLFYKITVTNMSYKDAYAFLKNQSTDYVKFVFSENYLKRDIIFGFLQYLKHLLRFSERFEFSLYFYEELEDTFSLNILVCLKVFGFDTKSSLLSYLNWLLKSLFDYILIVFLENLQVVEVFFFKQMKENNFFFLFNNSINYKSNFSILNVSFIYNYISLFLKYYNMAFYSIPFYPQNGIYFPPSLTKVNEKDSFSIIHLISMYLNIQGCFFDLNSNMIYKKVSDSKSTVFFFSSLDSLKSNFPKIFYFLKQYNYKDFMYEYEFFNTKYPLISFFFSANDYNLLDSAFSLLSSKPLLIQSVNLLDFDVIEYNNGFYSISDNYFYSFKSLDNYYPDNPFKFSNIIAYNYIKKKFLKSNFSQHELMSFLKFKLPKKDFIFFFSLLFYKNPLLHFCFDFYLVSLSKNNLVILYNFLKSVYINHPFICLYIDDLNWLDNKNLSFSKELPLFIFLPTYNLKVLRNIYNFFINKEIKPLKIIILVDNSSLEEVGSNLLMGFQIMSLHSNSFNYFFDLLIKYEYHFDLFVIMNIYYSKLNKQKFAKKFLTKYRSKGEGWDFFFESDEL